MSDERQQVTFFFSREMEVRYVPRVPAPGDVITHQQAPWVVSRVELNSIGVIATCERASASETSRSA